MPEQQLLTFEELSAAVQTIKKEFTEYKAEAEGKIKKAEAEAEKAKKEAEAKKGEGEAKKGSKYPKTMRAMKAAEEEKDEEKKAVLMAEAMKHFKSESEEEKTAMGPETLEEQKKEHKADDEKEEEEEKEAMKAELKILRHEAAKPRIAVLNASYKGRISADKLQTYNASWKDMSITELDAEIERVKPFVGESIIKQPLGFSTFETPTYSASKEDTFEADLQKKSVAELFA